MWTRRGPLPYGPRPGRSDNCICIDYYECFSPAEQDLIVRLYGPTSPARYTHAPLGPIVDAGYHGQLPSCDWRADPDVYLNAANDLQLQGIEPIHFLRPDRGCAGLDWTVEDLERELSPIFRTPKAQAIMRIVCLGWEPGPKYFYDNVWWVEMLQWQARTFPNALRCLHMVADCDAPVGTSDDGKPLGQMWANVALYLHVYLAQFGGYVDLDQGDPQFGQKYAAFKVEFAKAIRRNTDGFMMGVGGWPTFSAWGPDEGIHAMAGEYAAFADYWQNAPEGQSIELGDLAMAHGAFGYLDGGSVEVIR